MACAVFVPMIEPGSLISTRHSRAAITGADSVGVIGHALKKSLRFEIAHDFLARRKACLLYTSIDDAHHQRIVVAGSVHTVVL